MHVAIVCRLDRPGGVQSCAFSLVKGLNRLGIVPDILWDVAPGAGFAPGDQAGFQPVRFPFPSKAIDRLPESIRYLAWMANLIDGEKAVPRYDFFYIFYNGFLVSPETPHLRYLSGPPLLPQLENIPPGPRGIPIRLFKWLYRNGLHQVRPVYEYHRNSPYVINSYYTAGLFHEAHGVVLPVVHPPIDLAGRSFDENDLSRRDTLTFFSRVVSYKRPELVLELAYRHPELRCVIMGSVAPHQRPYFQKLQGRASGSSILFLDTPSAERVKKEFSRTRYFVFPARNEHFGMSTPEAIASGAIPYVHDSGGQREIVPDPELRFQDEEFFEKFEALLHKPESQLLAIRCKLVKHVQGFSDEVFLSKMLGFLPWPGSGALHTSVSPASLPGRGASHA